MGLNDEFSVENTNSDSSADLSNADEDGSKQLTRNLPSVNTGNGKVLNNNQEGRSVNSPQISLELDPDKLQVGSIHSVIITHVGESGGYVNKAMDNQDYNENNENISLTRNNNLGSSFVRKNSLKHREKVVINRDALEWNDIGHIDPNKKKLSAKTKAKAKLKQCCANCSPLSCFVSLFPIIVWLREYSIRNNLLNDMIAGFTISILHIPQGMAYGLLAGLKPEIGLYVSFFPVLIYTLMGTSRHISIGTFAVLSIMLKNCIDKTIASYPQPEQLFATQSNSTNATNLADLTYEFSLEIAVTVCLIAGIFQVLLGFLHLGALSVILSDTLVSGFSTGCAIHVATSQFSYLFDIKVPDEETRGVQFKLVYTWIGICKHIGSTNFVTLGVSIVSIIILVSVKEYIEPKLKKRFKLPVPIPIDILLVIGITIFSYLLQLNKNYNVKIMKDIPTGLPPPKLPRFDLIPSLITDSIVIAIVAFAISLSLAKIFAKKNKYPVDANQELLALGGANIISSMFSCYPSAASLSRSSVQDKTGGKTQIAGLFSCLVILVVLLFLGQFLYDLPKCILGAIILVALKSMFMQYNDCIRAFKLSTLEGFTWIVTFTSVVLLGVDIGLIVGIAFSIFVLLIRFSIPPSCLLGQLPNSEIYVDLKTYKDAVEIEATKIFSFSCALFFINRHTFRERLYSKTLDISSVELNSLKDRKQKIYTIILDCSSIFYIDSSGVEAIVEIIEEMKENNIQVYLASCPNGVITMFHRCDFFKSVPNANIFPSIHDAVVYDRSILKPLF